LDAQVPTVLVTGGAGYIGSHAVLGLAQAGWTVVAYDNLAAGHREAIDAIAGAWPGRVSLVEGDIADTARVSAAIRTHGVTAVMHFAAWLSVGESVARPAEYYRNNVAGTLGVLEALAATGVKAFIFSSTAATFGEPVETPITETHPQRPINAYGQTKLTIEQALPHFERAYGLRSVVLRYFNAAGADPAGLLGEDHDPEIHMIPRAVDAAMGRDALQVFGDDYPTPDGTCLRDYIHVTDLAEAHVCALRWLEGGGSSEAFNLGNGEAVSVRDVIRSVERVTGRPVPYTIGPRRPGDPAVLFASNARIRARLGWTPRFAALDRIVETAWRWREAHPRGYRTASV
jgi:UDP-glucose-4-epimerase GalE